MNIVFCADGTWNDPTDRTNVFKLFSLLEGGEAVPGERLGIGRFLYKESLDQRAFYVEGVGSHGTMNDLLAGATGIGLHTRVLDGYILISEAYSPGDKIYIFGFSRGAYTARSLAGLIAKAGLMRAEVAQSDVAREHAERVWWNMKHGADLIDAETPAAGTPIELVGVWDTVGALGIPIFTGIHAIAEVQRELFDFADTELSRLVRFGRHAVSIDSKRADFQPTLWSDREGIEQVWFAGVHSDVGGGYAETGLSDVALAWMLEEAGSLGLRLREGWRNHVAPNPLADRHESATGPVWTIRPTKVRKVPADATIHESVSRRFAERADYRPPALESLSGFSDRYNGSAVEETLAPSHGVGPSGRLRVDQVVDTDVFAQLWWNAARVEVQPDEQYLIEASGEWFDKQHKVTADGYEERFLDPFRRTRRVADAPWFCLIAAVHESPELGSVLPSILKAIFHEVGRVDGASQLVAIGRSGTLQVDRPGYLYLFANDAAFMYANNDGTLDVTVTRKK